MFSIYLICELMHKLRKRRNSIVHDRYEGNKNEARYCLIVADKILRNRFNNPNTLFLNVDQVRDVTQILFV